MENKFIELNDSIQNIHDEKNFNKIPSSGSFLKGEVEVRNELGELLFRKHNIILIAGRRFILEKLFNITPDPSLIMTLNQIYGIDEVTPPTTEAGPRKEKCVCLFGVGRGGSDLTFGSVKKPYAKELELYDMVPLRYSAYDLSDTVKQKYYFRQEQDDGMIAYYLKKFETDPKIVIKVGNQDYVPDINDTDNENGSGLIEREDITCYVELSLKIDSNDVREYFKATEGIDMARINEIALFTGFQPEHNTGVWTDYLDIEIFSKLTFNSEPLDVESKEMNITYRIYI